MKAKKAQSTINGLQALVAPLVGIAIVLAIGFLIFAEAKSQIVDTQSSGWCPDNYTYVESSTLCCNSTSVSDCTVGNRTNSGHSLAYNATSTTQEAMGDIPGWLPIIIVAVIGALILGLVKLFR